MIRLAVIDDHPTIIEGLKGMFKSNAKDICITCCAKTPKQALEEIAPNSFDILLLDLWLGTWDPLENIATFKHYYPGKPIIILTSEVSDRWRSKMMEAGASAYVLKNIEKADLKQTILVVSQGHKVYAGVPANQDESLSITKPQHHIYLTSKEAQVLKGLVQGKTQKEIAENLDSTVSYIEKVVKQLKLKFNTEKLPMLVAKAMDHPMIAEG